MNFYKRINELNGLYGTRPETEKCYSDCVASFVDYLTQLQTQAEQYQRDQGVTQRIATQ